MRNPKLDSFAATNFLNDGYPEVVEMAHPHFVQLIDALRALPETADEMSRLDCFRECVEGLNGMESYIETVERELFCSVLYQIGEIVGLDRKTEFVDRWREW